MKPASGLALAFALALGATATHAAELPRPGAADPRIRTVAYDPDQVVLLSGYFGYQMMIEFGDDERIETVSIGDGAAWQVTPNKKATLLFLKPLEIAAATNMTVVTDRRRYTFELSARRAPRGGVDDMAYVVRFLYPPEPRTVAVAAPAPAAPREPERRNLAYTYTGSREVLPSLVFDDGRFTYFQWPDAASTPAIFLLATDGSESLVNYGVRGGYLVVEQVAPRFVLRNGKAVTTIVNDAWRDPLIGAAAPRPRDAETARIAAEGAQARQAPASVKGGR